MKSKLEELGISHYEDLKSHIFKKETNLVKAYCNSSTQLNHLIQNGIIINHERLRVTKFIIKKHVIICYRCSGFGHISLNCRTPNPKCYKCSQNHCSWKCTIKDHKNQHNNEANNQHKYNCAGCGGDHPLTYGNCPTLKKEIQRLNTSYNQQPGHDFYRKESEFKPLKLKATNHQINNTHTSILDNTNMLNAITGLAKTVEALNQTLLTLNTKVNELQEATNTNRDTIGKVLIFTIKQLTNHLGENNTKLLYTDLTNYFNLTKKSIDDQLNAKENNQHTQDLTNNINMIND